MMNYPVYLEDDFLDILVFMYVCLNVKHLKNSMYFSFRNIRLDS